MIKTVRRVIKIGSSAGVTIPALDMSHHNIDIGDEVKITIEPIKKRKPSSKKLPKKLTGEYEAFIAAYGKTLTKLAAS